ncbi:MAG: hypothetical protein ACTSWP_06425 [Candidatus Freyarchaeota archaeon]|nr:hypothetical protein [Candidatus Freyrarchaeum guaymaensis]
MKAEWWLGKAKEKGLRVDWEERKLLEAKKWLLLGQNSDKFGWNPRGEKRIQGEYEFRVASEYAQVAGVLLSEHLIDKEKPPEGARTFLLYNFHNFAVPTMPLRVNLEFEKEMFEPSNLTLNVDGYPAPCDLINPDLSPDGLIRSGTLVFIENVELGVK